LCQVFFILVRHVVVHIFVLHGVMVIGQGHWMRSVT
jgi:hypothetical protein